MIPKVIHYCWFGKKPLSKSAKKCIASWKKFLPDYEIVEWNETNFDINSIVYVKQAYDEKKWAFVSDYVRFYVLYNFGGLYFDVDVELIKPIDDLINNGAFFGRECKEDGSSIAPGLGMASPPGLELYKEVLDSYTDNCFFNEDGTHNTYTIVQRLTDILEKKGFSNLADEIVFFDDVWIYPSEFFCPMNYCGELRITENTRSIHYYDSSWYSLEDKLLKELTIKSKDKPKFVRRFYNLISKLIICERDSKR